MNKIFFFISLLLITSTTSSQWTFETLLPNDSVHIPVMNQICVIDSSVSWALGRTLNNQNYFYPFIARRNALGWRYINTDLSPTVRELCFTATDSNNVWLGTSHPDEIYFSSNGGINWVLQFHVADTGHVMGIMFCKQNPQIGYAFGNLAFATFWNGVFILKTTNGGLNWSRWDFVFYGFMGADNSISVVDSTHAWFGVLNVLGGPEKIIMSSNGGINWIITELEIGEGGPFTIQFSNDYQIGLLVGETGATSWFYRTTNGGINWNIVYTTTYYYSETLRWVPGTSNIYGNSEFVLIRSTDSGVNWSEMSGGPGTNLKSMDAIRINYGTIYGLALTFDRKVYKLLDTARVIGIKNPGTFVPKEFRLHQNYPNPFNPVTTIKFDVPEDGNVIIEIYDLIGRVVAVLAKDEFKKAGSYQVVWDASSFSSGVYFYRLESGNFVDTKKMILLK